LIYAGHTEDGTPIDLNFIDKHGFSALTYACAANQSNIVRALLESGAELHVQHIPLNRLSPQTQAALKVGLCATFASATAHWWMAPRLASLMKSPVPIGELVLEYTGRMEARPAENLNAGLEPSTLTFLLAPPPYGSESLSTSKCQKRKKSKRKRKVPSRESGPQIEGVD
jgi:hypothetical protein